MIYFLLTSFAASVIALDAEVEPSGIGPHIAFHQDFSVLTLDVADAIAKGAIREASLRGFAPITVVVVDPAGFHQTSTPMHMFVPSDIKFVC